MEIGEEEEKKTEGKMRLEKKKQKAVAAATMLIQFEPCPVHVSGVTFEIVVVVLFGFLVRLSFFSSSSSSLPSPLSHPNTHSQRPPEGESVAGFFLTQERESVSPPTPWG